MLTFVVVVGRHLFFTTGTSQVTLRLAVTREKTFAIASLCTHVPKLSTNKTATARARKVYMMILYVK